MLTFFDKSAVCSVEYNNKNVIVFFFSDQSVPISWPQRGDIHFDNVSLRYEGQKQHVISNLTLKIPAGQRVSSAKTFYISSIEQ